MATAAIAPAPPETLVRRFTALIPGLLLLGAVGYAGKFIEQSIARYTKANHITFPNIEYVLWAIVIGLVIANTVGIPRIFQAGVATYEFWLKGRNRAARLSLPARRHPPPRRHLPSAGRILDQLSLTFMHLLGRTFSRNPSSPPCWRSAPRLRSLRHHRRQTRHRRRR